MSKETATAALKQQATASETVAVSQLPPLDEYLDPSLLDRLFGDFTPEGRSMLYGSIRFLWGEFVTTVRADGGVSFDRVRARRSPALEPLRQGVYTQYNAAMDSEYERMTDGGADELGETTTALRESGQQLETYPGELFAATLQAGGTQIDRFVDGIEPTTGDVVSVTGDAVAANQAITDELLATLGDTGTLLSTVRSGRDCLEATEMDLTVLDCTGKTDSSSRTRSLGSCDDLTTVGTEITKAVGHAAGREVFGFHSLSQLTPTASAGDVFQFLSLLIRKLRSWEVGGVFVGRPLALESPRLAELADYQIETRREDGRMGARVRGKSGITDRWQPVWIDPA